MKIAFVLESWGHGGTEEYVQRVGKILTHRGHKIILVLLKEGKPNLEWTGETVVILSGGIRKYAELTALLLGGKADLVHMHLYTSMLPAVLAVKYKAHLPVVATWHSPLHAWNRLHWIKQLVALRLVDQAIGGSCETGEELRKWNRAATAISPPIAISEQALAASSSEAYKIVGCGRLSVEKDWPVLFAALKIVRHQKPLIAFHCRIFGGGKLREELERVIHSRGVQDLVELVGHVPAHELHACIAAADLCILPSKFEGFGMAAVEGMALGVPTITSNFPASFEYLRDGETGSHFPIGNAEALAEKIIWHVEHPAESAAMGLRGKAFVEKQYSPEVIAEKHLEIYQSLCPP